MKTKRYPHETIVQLSGWLLPFLLLVCFPQSAWSQTVVEEEEDEEVVATNNDELVFTDQEGNVEEIEYPEAMTYDLDSLLNLYMSKNYLEADSDCNMRDINPTFSKEEYMERLSRMPTVMEMAYNDVVQTFIDRYSGRLRRSISLMLGASNFYMPIFEEALEAYQLPLELKYLPVIESALNPTAVSRVGATGLWQFMIGTGKQYGLKVNSLIDERRDPVKASYAAARFLRDLYRVFGDWNLVIAAYNCGPENINKAIRRANAAAGSTTAQEGEQQPTVNKDYWYIYPYLPRETRGYVPAFIAANYIMTYYSLHNICPMSSRLPAKTDTVMVSRALHLEQVAGVVGVNIELLRSLNPMYRRDIVPGQTEPCPLRLPQTEVGKFIDMEDSVYNYRADELLNKRIEVEVKDDAPTYYHRSKRYARGNRGRYAHRNTRAARGRKGVTTRRSTVSRSRSTAKRRTPARRRRRR